MKKLATVVAVTLLGASLAVAAPYLGGEGHGHRGAFARQFAQALNLTDAQKAQIRDIRKASHQENLAFFQSVRQTRQEFRAAKEAGDTAKLDALRPAIQAQRAQMKQIRAAANEKIAAILTPEQNAKWQQLKADWKAQHQQNQR